MTEDVDESGGGAGAGRHWAAREECHHWLHHNHGAGLLGRGRGALGWRAGAGLEGVAGELLLLGARHQASGSSVVAVARHEPLYSAAPSQPPRSGSRHQPPHTSLNPAQPSHLHS